MPSLDIATLDDLRGRRPRWVNEPHPQFCRNRDGCDGTHGGDVVEVDVGVGVLLVRSEMDHGHLAVSVTDVNTQDERRLSPDAALDLAFALIAAAHTASTQARMVRKAAAA